MDIIPAIDIIEGKCVRLEKGDYNKKTNYADDPVEVAKEFEGKGIKRLHLVDLDGAKASHVVNIDILRKITRETNLSVDFGGGVKSQEDIDKVFDAGAEMVTGGSIAVKNPDLFKKWVSDYGPEKIILGADVLGEKIMISGWQDNTRILWIEFLEDYIKEGIKYVISTDISRDGMLTGPSFELYDEMLNRFPEIELIASGGVSSNEDVLNLKDLGVSGTIIGKAYYEGKIDLEKLVQLC